MAIEAVLLTIEDANVKLIKVEDIEVGRQITFDESSGGREVRFNLALLESFAESTTFSWSVYFNGSADSSSMILNASGRTRVSLESSTAAGDAWVKRHLGKATGAGDASTEDDCQTTMLKLHPAVLDLAFQASCLAYAAPEDGRFWGLHVPTSIRSISTDAAALFAPQSTLLTNFRFLATVGDPLSSSIDGVIDIYDSATVRTLLQVESLRAVPLSTAVARDDCKMFTDLRWGLADPDGELVATATSITDSTTTTIASRLIHLDANESHAVDYLSAMV
nr:polyketide synthase-nonribosomal peptide synthetase [Quercus suber]